MSPATRMLITVALFAVSCSADVIRLCPKADAFTNTTTVEAHLQDYVEKTLGSPGAVVATLGKGCNEEGGADLDLFALVLSESDVNLTQECLQGSSDTSCDTLVEFIEYNMTATVVDFCTKLDIATLQTELEFYLDGQAMESDIYCADGKNPAKAPITGAMLADFTTCLDVTSRCSEVTAPLPDLTRADIPQTDAPSTEAPETTEPAPVDTEAPITGVPTTAAPLTEAPSTMAPNVPPTDAPLVVKEFCSTLAASATEEGVKSFFSIPTLTVEAVTTNAKGCSTVDAIKYRVTLTPANANTIGACLLGSAMPGCVGSGAFPAEFSQPVEVVQAFVCLEIYTTYEEEIAVMETALSRFVNGWVSVDAHQPEDTCAGSDGRVGEEVTVSMSVSSAANGLFSDCLYAASSNMTECAQTDPPFPIHVTSRFERTTAPNTQAPPEFPSEEISLCLESAKTLDESVADIAAYTNGLVSGVSIAADGLGCTDRSYRLVTVKVTAGTETDVTKCAADASLCPGFPTALPHVAPSKGEICIKKTGTTLTTEDIQTAVDGLEAFLNSTVVVAGTSDLSQKCAEGEGLMEYSVSATTETFTRFDNCLKSTERETDASCSGFPTGLSAQADVPRDMDSEEDDSGFPVWLIIVIAGGGALLIGLCGAFFYMRSRKPNFKMNFGEQCGALDELEMDNNVHFDADHVKPYEAYADEQPVE